MCKDMREVTHLLVRSFLVSFIGGTYALGCPAVSLCAFMGAGCYIGLVWPKDMNGPRFMLSGFMFNMSQLARSVRGNSHILLLIIISALCESCISIFTFYWAPWITEVGEKSSSVPYEIIFATYIGASSFGNYCYQIIVPYWGNDAVLQMLLVGSSGAYFCGAVFQTPSMVFLISIGLQACVGAYWPSIGFLRGRYVLPEQRGTCITVTRIVNLAITVSVLMLIHHSAMMTLIVCAALFGAASYLQHTMMQANDILPGGSNDMLMKDISADE